MNPCQNDITFFPVTNTIETIQLTNNENDPNTSTRRTENDSYTILWESDFDFKVFEPRKEN